ncbi:MAG: AAA family ATPase [Thermoplasmata archaeon]
MEKFSQHISEKMYNFNAADALEAAWKAGENIILFGRGGYGKSEAALLFYEYLKHTNQISSPVFVQSFGLGMTEERLFGGMNIKLFQQEGRVEYLLENSFANYEFVVFEEFFDAPAQVLLILKDCLTSKTVRNGSQIFPIKTKFIVACTNRSYEEVVQDNSTAALLERFIFQVEVKWNSYTTEDYFCLFNKTCPSASHLIKVAIAQYCAEVAKSHTHPPISPRTAVKALKAVTANNNDCKVIKNIKNFEGFNVNFNLLFEVEKDLAGLDVNPEEITSPIKAIKMAKKCNNILSYINKNINLNEHNYAFVKSIAEDLKNKRNTFFTRSQALINCPPHGSFLERIKNSSLSEFDFSLVND